MGKNIQLSVLQTDHGIVPYVLVIALTLTSEVFQFCGQLAFKGRLVHVLSGQANLLASTELYVWNFVANCLYEEGNYEVSDVVFIHLFGYNCERLDCSHSVVVTYLVLFVGLDDFWYEGVRDPCTSEGLCESFSFAYSHFSDCSCGVLKV